MNDLKSGLMMRAALVASVVALLCAVVMGFVIRPPKGVDTLQPSIPKGPASEFLDSITADPAQTLRFFAADSLFVLSYGALFVGLYAVVAERARPYAWVGLGAGLLAAALDGVENAHYITYARLATAGESVADPALPLIYVLANLKWSASFAAMAAFGLVWPREDWLGWALTAVLLLFPLVGVLGVAWSGLVTARGLFFLVGLVLFVAYFGREMRGAG